MNYKCPCCGYYTFSEKPGNTFDICPVCFWEDDNIQFKDIDYEGGANNVSLRQARINFEKYQASCENVIKFVRKPNEDELSGIDYEIREIDSGDLALYDEANDSAEDGLFE